MKINNKIINILIIILLLLTKHYVWAIEFKTEQEKGVWIKNFFKDKEMAPIEYPMKATEEKKKFERQLIKDFIIQNGIEHIEPIARGKSLSDTEIAKYNKACPEKKPIDMYKWWPCIMWPSAAIDDEAGCVVTEEMLEDKDNDNEYINIYRCNGNMKIYRFNLYNTSDAKQEYVLYCDDQRGIRMFGKIHDINEKIDDSSITGTYLHFDPEKCLYSELLTHTHPFWGDAVTGIFKYQGKNYLYEITTTTFKPEGEVSKIFLECKEGVLNAKFFSAKTKGRLK